MAATSRLSFWCVLGAICAASLAARAAERRPIAEAIEIRSGAACVTRERLGPELATWLGAETIERDLSVLVIGSDSDPRDVSFEVWRGDVRLAHRRFHPAPAGCGPLHAIVALAIAMALEVSVRAELMALVDDTRDDSGPSYSAGAFAEIGLGLLPGTSAGLALRGEINSLLVLRLAAFMHASQNHRLRAGPASVDVDAWLAGARLAACVPVELARALILRTCAGLGAGGMYIGGRGASGAHSSWLPWVDVAAGAELRLSISESWSFDAGGNLELPLGERSFGVSDADGSLVASRTLPDVAGSLHAGPAYHF